MYNSLKFLLSFFIISEIINFRVGALSSSSALAPRGRFDSSDDKLIIAPGSLSRSSGAKQGAQRFSYISLH